MTFLYIRKVIFFMITKFKIFEGIRDEYPGIFEPKKPDDEPQVVPGFELGAIDPDDDEPYTFAGDGHIQKSDAESYKKFLKITKERNYEEDDKHVTINIKRLYQDFYMSIYNPKKYFKKFVDSELMGKYIFNSISDYDNEIYNGTISNIEYVFDGYSAFLEFKLKEIDLPNLVYNKDYINIDKLKTTASEFNI